MQKNYFPRNTAQVAEELMRSVESENKAKIWGFDLLANWSQDKKIPTMFTLCNMSDEKFKPKWFEYLPDRIYAVDVCLHPIIIDPIIAKWVKCDAESIKEDFNKIRENNRKQKYYLKTCLMYYINNLSLEFRPDDLIEKLDLLTKDKNIAGMFSSEEQEHIIKKCVEGGKILLACELTHRGFDLNFEQCMELGGYGSLLYSISMAKDNDIELDRSFKDCEANSILKKGGYLQVDDIDEKEDNKYYKVSELQDKYNNKDKSENIGKLEDNNPHFYNKKINENKENKYKIDRNVDR